MKECEHQIKNEVNAFHLKQIVIPEYHIHTSQARNNERLISQIIRHLGKSEIAIVCQTAAKRWISNASDILNGYGNAFRRWRASQRKWNGEKAE